MSFFRSLFLLSFVTLVLSALNKDKQHEYEEEFQSKRSGNGVCEWNYDRNSNKGPYSWWKLHYPSCRGSLQSPINIVTKNLGKGTTSKNRIQYCNYNSRPAAKEYYTLENNGHTLIFKLPSQHKYRLQKGNELYKPLQIHIHFGGLGRQRASEHNINGRAFVGEIHMVHAMVNNPNKLLVIATMVEYSGNAYVSWIVKKLGNNAKQSLKHSGSSISMNAIPLSLFLPYNINLKTASYANYDGSLTTPPCTESVDWIVLLKERLWIDYTTILNLQSVTNCNGTPLGKNFRPLQRTNGRKVVGVNFDD